MLVEWGNPVLRTQIMYPRLVLTVLPEVGMSNGGVPANGRATSLIGCVWLDILPLVGELNETVGACCLIPC